MILAKYAWLVLVICTLINIPVLWRRVAPYIAMEPELEPGYRRLIHGLIFWMCLPWIVMGIGCTMGGIPNFLQYLQPAKEGPFVWAFWVSVYTEFLLLSYWAIWCGGAEILVRYPGVISNFRITSVRTMRWILVGSAVFGIIWNTTILVAITHGFWKGKLG